MREENEEQILINNIKQFNKSADLVYKTKDYTSATILYFKTFFAVLDLIILKNTGKIPKGHTERFRILESTFKDLYRILDEDFTIYRQTYTTRISKENCDKVKENVKRIIKGQKISENS